MRRSSAERYLWDRSGPVDVEVAALERLLGRYGHEAGATGAASGGADRPRTSAWRRSGLRAVWVTAAAVVVVAGLWGLGRFGGRSPKPDVDPTVDPGVVVVAVRGGAELSPGAWLEVGDAAAVVEVGDVGSIDVAPGTRLRVEEARRQRTRLFVATGRIDVFVAPDAGARFFQVRTPATLCVDLGCRYRLEVDGDSGETWVRVELGQVAFESAGRGVHVPRGAEARAWPGDRLGTPRFAGLPVDLRELLDAYDAAGQDDDQRAAIARKFASVTTMPRDTLPLWHMLLDREPRVVRTAEQALVRIAGLPPAAMAQKQPAGIDPAVWRAHVEDLWW